MCSRTRPLLAHGCLQALGRGLLRSLEAGRFAKEGFLACRRLEAPSEYVILTRAHILVVTVPHIATSRWRPSLLWEAALGDVELCKTKSGGGTLLVQTPVDASGCA